MPLVAYVYACAIADHDSLFRVDRATSDRFASRSELGSRHNAGSDQPDTVVPVTELPSLLQLRESLAAAARDDPEQPPHARAFAAWVQQESLERTPHLKTLATQAAAVSGPARQTAHAAVLGYAAHLDSSFIVAFVEALDWLRQRQYFVAGRPRTFEVDGLGLFGIAVGIVSTMRHEDQPSAGLKSS